VPITNVKIKARAPLLISACRIDGQFRPSYPYIPGAVWRGSLAQQMLNAGEATGDGSEFAAIFTDDDAPLFRNAFPAHIDENGNFEGAIPLPATAFSCKAESGFKKQGKHGVFDSLIDRLCCEELGVRAPYLSYCDDSSHAHGGERVETFSGFHHDGRNISAPLHLTTRVAINRQRKVAEPNLLYSPLVISESAPDDTPTVFCGSIVMEEKVRAIVEPRLRQLAHIGSSASRGFGRVEVTSEPITTDDLSGRLRDFNEWIRKRWRLWEQIEHDRTPPHTPDNGAFFAVLLLADAVLRDDGWTPTVRLEPHMLGLDLQDVTLLRCYATPEYRGGWNTAWRLPKDTELVARMSSVYVYHTPRRADDEGLLNALCSLEERGVGERRREGFGQARVCDEFHIEVQNPTAGGENR
jgi:CRISPR-associated protein Csx10